MRDFPDPDGVAVRSVDRAFIAQVGSPLPFPKAEADVMDWADDVTSSVHDIEGFYKGGRIPYTS
jgi:hypothetical protein